MPGAAPASDDIRGCWILTRAPEPAAHCLELRLDLVISLVVVVVVFVAILLAGEPVFQAGQVGKDTGRGHDSDHHQRDDPMRPGAKRQHTSEVCSFPGYD